MMQRSREFDDRWSIPNESNSGDCLKAQLRRACCFLLLEATGVILILPMVSHWQHKTALLLLLTYVSAGALVVMSHHDFTDLYFHQSARFASHDCGSNEIHVPLDKRHECLACSQTTMRIATVTTPVCINSTPLLCFCTFQSGHEHLLCAGVLHSGKRGPPISS
jgi:hypothetical protein